MELSGHPIPGGVMRLCCAVLALTLVAVGPAIARAEAALHPGDKIEVTVYNHPELSATRTVDAAGNVSLPLAGTVAALNLAPDAVAASVKDRLAPYVRDVAVQVQLSSQSDSIFVSGGPIGVIKYEPGMTISSVVDHLQAGTPVPTVDNTNHTVAGHDVANSPLDLVNGPIDFDRVSLLRDGKTIGPLDVLALRTAGQPGPILQPGDTIELSNKPIAVPVQGDVERPGTAYLNEDEPLSTAIDQVGGTAATSTLSGIVLTRNGTSQTVSIGNPLLSQPAQRGDRLVVPRAPRVDVLGNVTKPGDTLLRGNTSLVSAIYYAGGPAQFANLKAVTVVHDGVRKQYNLTKIQKGGTGDNPTLSDGDIVLVPQGSTFEWNSVWSGLGALGLFGVHI
jgi:protein involved in polysaccharide export with SLBB domain